MRKIAIVTDSTSDIELSIAQKMKIRVVPLYVQMGDQTFIDNVDITREQIYETMAQGVIPKTSQPTQADFRAVFEQVLTEAEHIIVICIGELLSGTLSSARTAASELQADQNRFSFIDSRCTSAGLGLVVMHAATLAEEGYPAEEVVSQTQALVNRTRMYGTFDTLKYVLAGGRFDWGKAGEIMGNMIPVKPVLLFKNGKISVSGFCRTRKKAIEKMCSFVKETFDNGNLIGNIGILYGTCKEEALEIQKYFDSFTGGENEIYLSQLGPALAVHGGGSTLAISFEDASLIETEESDKKKGLRLPKIRLPFSKNKN